MPKTTTTFYTSEHASRAEAETRTKLFVYTCKYTGKHALVTDVSLDDLPKRPRDGSSVLDMGAHRTKLYLADAGLKRIRRESDGKVERQYRLRLGELPVAYTSKPEGKVLFILKNALSEYTPREETYGESFLPPAFQEEMSEEGAAVKLMIDLGRTAGSRGGIGDTATTAPATRIGTIWGDRVKVFVSHPPTSAEAKKEILEFFTQVLEVRQPQLAFQELGANKGFALRISGMTPLQVFRACKKRGGQDKDKERERKRGRRNYY